MVCKIGPDSIMENPTKDQLDRIRQEIGEDEAKLRHNENLLSNWIQLQPQFPKNYDKRLVRGFLRGCKHNLEKTKTRLEYHFTYKSIYPDLFSGRDTRSKNFQSILDTVSVVYVPKVNEKGNRLVFFRLESVDASKFDMTATVKLFFMVYDLMLTTEHPVAGETAIFDASGITPAHYVKFLSPVFRHLHAILRNAYAIRLKQMHIVNPSKLIEAIVTTTKPLLHPNVRNTFVVHQNPQGLLDYFEEDVIPSNYGGKAKSISSLWKSWREVLTSQSDWFVEQENVKIKNSLHAKKSSPVYFNEQIGLQGSFRKLEID